MSDGSAVDVDVLVLEDVLVEELVLEDVLVDVFAASGRPSQNSTRVVGLNEYYPATRAVQLKSWMGKAASSPTR